MREPPKFPLLARVLGWLVLHLVILALAFFLFVRWQLGLGLDSLLSGSAGDQLAAYGETVRLKISDLTPRQWNDVIQPLAEEKNVSAGIFDTANPRRFPKPVPRDVIERARAAMPPPRPPDPGPPGPGAGRPPRPRFGGPDELPPFGPPVGPGQEPGVGTETNAPPAVPKCRPAFLMRGEDGGYWAGVVLHLPPHRARPARAALLLIHSDRLDGSGMFFDFKPWLWGGMAVLVLSLAFWTPFVWGITRYLHRLAVAADQIASGNFQISLPARGNDELGHLGRTIESMAARLDHLVSGQKRFLGDAAHELCAPLARIRTALGILETKLEGTDPSTLSSIEADTSELAALIEEILAFSRAGNRKPALQSVDVESLVRGVLARESADGDVEVIVPSGLKTMTDPTLLGRAIGNLVRNAAVHAGPGAKVQIEVSESAEHLSISVADNGPGVPADEIARIFEPFYRLDRARSRDTGGSGLGLAIVRTAVEALGGEAIASRPENGGLKVTLRLPKIAPAR